MKTETRAALIALAREWINFVEPWPDDPGACDTYEECEIQAECGREILKILGETELL